MYWKWLSYDAKELTDSSLNFFATKKCFNTDRCVGARISGDIAKIYAQISFKW